MLKIGDFSKLSLVSVKALRYYDERGLLKPARVDPSTGYRFYSASQLTRLNRILAMKDMGLDLSQIALLLDQEPTPDQIRGMLWLKQVELHQQLEEGQARLARIEAWLQAFEQEATMPEYDVVIKSVVALQVAQSRGVAPKMEQPELGIVRRLHGGTSVVVLRECGANARARFRERRQPSRRSRRSRAPPRSAGRADVAARVGAI